MVSVDAIVPGTIELVITQFADQANLRFISQMIRGTSRIMQRLLKYFNGITISKAFVLSRTGFLFLLLLPEVEIIKNLICCHLDQFCGTAIKFLILSHNYCCTLLDYTSASQYPVPCITHLCVIYFADAVSKWCTNFKCYLLISFVCIPFC